MSLALATLIYEWRRYLAAVIALAFSGMMVLAFSGMFTGIVHSELATSERSRADLFILPSNVEGAGQQQRQPAGAGEAADLPAIPRWSTSRSSTATAPSGSTSPKPGQKQVQTYVQIFGVEPDPGSVTLPIDFPRHERIALMEPGAVAIDASDLGPLGVKLGDKAVAERPHGLGARRSCTTTRAREQPVVVTSRETLRLIGMDAARACGSAR